MKATKLVANRYEILEELGIGGMGVVNKVRDRLTNDTLAMKQVLLDFRQIKFMSKHSTSDESLALMQEFRMLAGLRHPHIVSVQDFGFEGNMPFYTMLFLENAQTITAYARNQDTQTKVRVILELLQAITYLHRHGILHRDLKPDNVLVNNQGQVKVLDFGLARVYEDPASEDDHVVGTLAYMAPEILHKQEATILSDLYAIGVMAYEIFIGKHPHENSNISSLLYKLVSEVPDTKTVDPELSLFLDTLLEKDPVNRYQNASDVMRALCRATSTRFPKEDINQRESFLQASRLVGRKQELKLIEESLDKITDEQGRTWLIGGESGVGKSRLVDEAKTHALVSGAFVLRGQAVEGGGLPFQLWRNPLRHYILSLSLHGDEASILKEIIPDIDILLGYDVPDISPLKGAAHRQRLVDTIVAVLIRTSKPIVLVLEDLQWVTESLLPLQKLLTEIDKTPILVIATYRNDEVPDLPQKLPEAQVITLDRLDKQEIQKLTTAMLGEQVAQPHVVDLLSRETEGNVFFIVEIVRALAEDAGRLSNIGRLTLPQHIITQGVQSLVQRRLQLLPASIQDWLKSVAIAGRQLDLAVIDEIARQSRDNADEEIRDNKLIQCLNAAVMQVENEQWQFAHDKIRDVIIADLDSEKRQSLHREVALAIEEVYPDDDAHYERLLEHWYQANNIEKEYDYVLKLTPIINGRTGDYSRSRKLLDRLTMRLDENDVRYITLLNKKADAYWGQGLYKETTEVSKEALQLARKNNFEHEQAVALRGLGIAAAHKGRTLEARDYFSESMMLLQKIGRQKEATYLAINLGNIANLLGELDKATEYYEQGLEFLELTNDKSGQAMTLINYGSLAFKQQDYHTALERFYKTLDLHQPTIFFESFTFTLIGVTYHKLGRAESKEALHKALVIARKIEAANLMIFSLIGIAPILIANKDAHQAAQWAGLAKSHPAADSALNLLFDSLLAELRLHLSPEILEQEMEDGKLLDLIAVIDNLLEYWDIL